MKRAFVSIATENYHYLSLCLARSIQKYSEFDLHIFCLNYHPQEKNLETPDGIFFHNISYPLNEVGQLFDDNRDGNFYVNRKNIRSFQVMTRKSEACLKVLEMGYDEACYIDGDSIACPNIDQIFDYSLAINRTPLLTKGPHEFVMVPDENGVMRGNPFDGCWPEVDLTKTLEWPLMQFLQVNPDQRDEYRTGNLFIFNQNCREFLQTLQEFLHVMWKLVDVYYYSPFQDETPFNVLVWKNGGGGLPMSYINVNEGLETVKKFYETNFDEDTLVGDFLRIPKDKNQIKVLHGEKREQEIEKIIQHLDLLKESGYFDRKS
jgi:hypothetical protein